MAASTPEHELREATIPSRQKQELCSTGNAEVACLKSAQEVVALLCSSNDKNGCSIILLFKITQTPKLSPLSEDLLAVCFHAPSFAFSVLLSDSRSVFLLLSSLTLSDLEVALARTWRPPALSEDTVFLCLFVVTVILFLRADVL